MSKKKNEDVLRRAALTPWLMTVEAGCDDYAAFILHLKKKKKKKFECSREHMKGKLGDGYEKSSLSDAAALTAPPLRAKEPSARKAQIYGQN